MVLYTYEQRTGRFFRRRPFLKQHIVLCPHATLDLETDITPFDNPTNTEIMPLQATIATSARLNVSIPRRRTTPRSKPTPIRTKFTNTAKLVADDSGITTSMKISRQRLSEHPSAITPGVAGIISSTILEVKEGPSSEQSASSVGIHHLVAETMSSLVKSYCVKCPVADDCDAKVSIREHAEYIKS